MPGKLGIVNVTPVGGILAHQASHLRQFKEKVMALTTMMGEGSLVGMKKKLTNLPLNALLQTAQLAGQNAAANAVAAGRRVAGWKDGCLVEYGQDAMPLPLRLSERKIASGGA